jgi:hypothetical protein
MIYPRKWNTSYVKKLKCIVKPRINALSVTLKKKADTRFCCRLLDTLPWIAECCTPAVCSRRVLRVTRQKFMWVVGNLFPPFFFISLWIQFRLEAASPPNTNWIVPSRPTFRFTFPCTTRQHTQSIIKRETLYCDVDGVSYATAKSFYSSFCLTLRCMNYIIKIKFLPTGKTLHLHYKDQLVNNHYLEQNTVGKR